MKRVLSILLAFCLVFSLSGTAFAAKTCNCDKTPIVYVRGFGAPLYASQTNEKIYPPEKEDFEPVMTKIVFAALALLGGFYRVFADLAMDAAQTLFENVPCDDTGVPIVASNVLEQGYPSSDYHKSNSLRTYDFPYDWRVDPMETAQQLRNFVRHVERVTGHSKISFVCHSMGSVIFASYLAQYGSDGIDSVVFLAPAFEGVTIMGSLLSGEADIGDKGDEVTMFLQSLPMLTDARVKKAVDVSGKLRLIHLLLRRLQPALDFQFVRVFRKFLRPTFVTMPGIWSFVSDRYYERAKAFSFGSDKQYTELIRKLDRYHYGVQTRLVDLLRDAQANGMKMSIVSGYGISSMPLSYEHTMQSDILIATADSSIGAICAPFGETLPQSHVQSVEDGHDHISADNLVDASTCAFPEQTWFIRDLMHFDFPYENESFILWLFRQKTQPTVQTDERYPQFMRQVGDDLLPVTE